MIGWIVFGIIILLLLLGFVIPLRISYNITFKKRGDGKLDPYSGLDHESFAPYKSATTAAIDRLRATPCEEIRIKSQDGLTLYGRYFHVRDGAPIELQMHGYRSTPIKDFSGGACSAIDKGHNILLVDQRAHGDSEGRTISFGINEKYDCLAWLEYLAERFGTDTPVILVGISMGAATVLMASGLELPENVACIIADCPYSTPKAIITKVAGEMGIPGKLLFPTIRLGGRLFGGFDVCSDSPLEAVKRSAIPTILIHGEADGYVPSDMSREIYEAIPHSDKKRITFAGADHGLSFLADPERYLREINEFNAAALAKWREKR